MPLKFGNRLMMMNTYTGLTGFGGGGPFLFLAEQTEHDSSEQLLAEEPDGDDYNNIHY